MGRPRAPHLLLPQLNISLVLVNAMLWLAPTATHCTWQSQEQTTETTETTNGVVEQHPQPPPAAGGRIHNEQRR
jgi:hypothetical protein